MSFEIENKSGCLMIHCNSRLDAAGGDGLAKLLTDLTQKASSLATVEIVLDLKGTVEVAPEFLSKIAPAVNGLNGHGKKVFVLNASSTARDAISIEGMAQGLVAVNSLEEALPKSRTDSSTKGQYRIDVNFITPFIEGAINTLKIQCQFDCKPGKIYLKGTGPTITTDIAAVIGITSKGFNGSVSICFPKAIFLGIMSNMLGEPQAEITRELEDGASELLNIIFGQAKTTLNSRGHSFEKALPTIVRGNDLKVKHLTKNPTIVMPFETPVGEFHMEISTEPLARQ